LIYRRLIRPILFAREAEQVHDRTMRFLSTASRSKLLCGTFRSLFGALELPIECFGLKFPNPVGLAAGLDKKAAAVPAWEVLGFGFSELGAVTWHAQPGNPPPRLFRAISEEAIVNRMGFNNPGAEAVAATLQRWRAAGRWPRHPVGINLGKSKITPIQKAAQDYANSFRVLLPYLDFFVVNVSSPNTPNLRQLQDKAALDEILAALDDVRNSSKTGPAKPILVKVAPDLTFEALDEIVDLAGKRNLAGIIATNTTISRPPTSDAGIQRVYDEAGGLSGRPLRQRSTEVIRHLYRSSAGKLPIIGVGGIFNPEDAWEKIIAGASLVQIYTGLIYEGPGLAKRIVKGLRAKLEQKGLKEIKEAVGLAVKQPKT
jgi:dihydroorotate dehydrogenase